MFLRPESVIERFQLGEGMRVADLGVGTGVYTLAAAEAVGEHGVVYACDVQKELLTKLTQHAEERGLKNITVIWSNLEDENGSTLADGSVDAAIATNILFQVEHKENFMKEVSRIVRPGGKVLIVDWSDSTGGVGPHAGAVVRRSVAQSLADAVGLQFEKDVDAGSHHYGMIFRKPRR